MAFTMEVPDEAAIKKEVMEQVEPAPEEVGELQALAEKNVALEYLYSFVRTSGDQALIIMRVDKLEDAVSVLREANVKLLTQAEVSAL